MPPDVGTVRWLFSEKARRRRGAIEPCEKPSARGKLHARRGRRIYLASFLSSPPQAISNFVGSYNPDFHAPTISDVL
jgi:hypothetical protein